MNQHATEQYAYTPEQVANTFIAISIKDKTKDLTPLKLIKLVYIFYAWYLVYYDGKAPFREKPEAWAYGPVFPSLYREYGRYKKENLDARHLAINWDIDSGERINSDIPIVKEDSETNALNIIWAVWESYKDKSGEQLSDITHREGSAWHQARKISSNCPLDNDLIIKGAKKALDEKIQSQNQQNK